MRALEEELASKIHEMEEKSVLAAPEMAEAEIGR
jgi:hypothetical protein